MLYLLISLIAIFIAVSNCAEEETPKDTYKFYNCDYTAPIRLNITSLPEPLVLKKNEIIPISFTLSILKKIPAGVFVELSFGRKKDQEGNEDLKEEDKWEHLACPGCDFGFNCKKIPEICFIRDSCVNCSMSVSNLQIKLPSNIEETIKEYMPNFGSGYYWIRAQFVNPMIGEKEIGRSLGCFEIYTKIQSGDDDYYDEDDDDDDEDEDGENGEVQQR